MHKIDFIYSYNYINYDFALSYMKNKVDKIINEEENQAIWLLEHPNIYTAGRSANKSEILKKINIPYYYTDRGGKFTYHGPGQRIIYVMLDLQKIFTGQPDLKMFIKKLGIWVSDILKQNGIVAKMDSDNIGIWVNHGKSKKKLHQ